MLWSVAGLSGWWMCWIFTHTIYKAVITLCSKLKIICTLQLRIDEQEKISSQSQSCSGDLNGKANICAFIEIQTLCWVFICASFPIGLLCCPGQNASVTLSLFCTKNLMRSNLSQCYWRKTCDYNNPLNLQNYDVIHL